MQKTMSNMNPPPPTLASSSRDRRQNQQPPSTSSAARRTSRTPSELSTTTTATATSNPAHNHAFMLASSLRSSVSRVPGQQPPSDDADVRLLCEELEDMDLESQFAASQAASQGHGRAGSVAGMRDSHLRFRASAMDPFPFDGDDLWLAAGTAKADRHGDGGQHAQYPELQQQSQQRFAASQDIDPVVSDLDFVLGNTNTNVDVGSLQPAPSSSAEAMAQFNEDENQAANKKLSIIEEVTEATTNHSHSHSHSQTATHFRQQMLNRISSPSRSFSSPSSTSPTSPQQPPQPHQQAPSSPTLTLPGGIRRGHYLDPQPHNSPGGSINSSTLTIRGPAHPNPHEAAHTPRAASGGNLISGLDDQHLDTSYHQLLQPDHSASDRVSSLGLVGASDNHGYADDLPPPPNHIILDDPTSMSAIENHNHNDPVHSASTTTSGLSSLEPAPDSPLAHKTTPTSGAGSMRSRHGSLSVRGTPFSLASAPSTGRSRVGSAPPASASGRQPLDSPLDHRTAGTRAAGLAESVRRLSSAATSTTARPSPGGLQQPAEAAHVGASLSASSSSSTLDSLASWRMQVAAAGGVGGTRRRESWEYERERREADGAQEQRFIEAPSFNLSAESTPPHQFLPNADLIDDNNHHHKSDHADEHDDDQGAYIHGVTTADFDIGATNQLNDHDHDADRHSVLSSDSSITSISLRYKNYSNQAPTEPWQPLAVQGTMGLPFVTPPRSSGMPSPATGAAGNMLQHLDGAGDYSMATPDTSPPAATAGTQHMPEHVRPATPSRDATPTTPAALTMTAVRRQLHNRLSAAEDTPLAFHDALASLENIAVPASYLETPKPAGGKQDEVTPRPRSAAAVQLKLLEMASSSAAAAAAGRPAPSSPAPGRGPPPRPASASGTVRASSAQVGFAGTSTRPREVGMPIDVGSSTMDVDDESRDRISLRIGSAASSPAAVGREPVLPEPSFARSSRPVSPAAKQFTWAPIPYVMPPDTPAPARFATSTTAASADQHGGSRRSSPARSPSPPAVSMHPALTQTLLSLAPNRSLASLASVSSLDLTSRALPSLERLDALAPRLVTLHAGHNALQFVQGVPATVRTLLVPMNRLAPLSSFHHLATSLHTLDISGNLMDDLFPLKCLVNLQSLNADKNGVRKWDKIPSMPALRRLSLRGNHIPDVDGTVVDLPALQVLDLADNCVSSVVGLGEGMPALQVLNLDNNALMGPMPGGHTGVVELSVLDNMIDLFDARMWPAVKRVELGGNKVARVELEAVDQVEYVGLARQAHMDARVVRGGGGGGMGGRARAASGSMGMGRPRRASAVAAAHDELDEETLRLLAPEGACHGDEPQVLDYADLQPVSRLNLSGNILPSLDRFVHMYQLVHLNLAGCGLRSLPDRFARHVPALRVLDLAQNCLQDISQLCKLTRLRWLSLRGNDVADFFHAVGYLAHLTRLEWLDLRQNPLTGLFYPNLVSTSAAAAANGGGGSTSRQEATTDDHEWAGIDAEYQRSLNDSTVVKRACYRTSLLFHLRASLQVLDRLHISEQERINVPAKYARMEKSLAGIMTGGAGGGSMRNAGGGSLSTKSSATNTPAARAIGFGGGPATPSRGGMQQQAYQVQQQMPQPPRALTPIDRRATESPRSRPQHPASPLAHAVPHQQHHTLPVPSLGSNYAPSGPIDEGSDHDQGGPGSPLLVPASNVDGGDKSLNPPAPSGGSSTSMQASWVQQYGDLTSETDILREIHQLTANERGRKVSSPLSPGRYRLEQAGSSVASPASTVIRPPALRH